MTYNQTLEYLYSQLPMFHRIGSAAYKANLDNTIAICELLKNPQDKFRTIHVAGTNGKGSVSHMLASILQEAGYKVGLYTSPHLKDFRERIRINGKMISKKYVVDFVEKNKKEFEKIKPSFFEMTVGLAFDYFSHKKVDVAVIEVGLGGRLDSTNIIHPDLCVITNISYDHMNLLGNTLPKIAAEKAGIIKKNGLVVIGERQKEVEQVFTQKAKSENAFMVYADDVFKVKNVRQVKQADKIKLTYDVYTCEPKPKAISKRAYCGLLGLYQQHNLQTVYAAVYMLRMFKKYDISSAALNRGVENVIENTSLMGRWQILGHNPLVVADTAHNEAGVKEVIKQIESISFKKLHMVIGMVNDKDISKILSLLPKKASYYFCKANIPRAMDADELASRAEKLGLKGLAYSSVGKALQAAKIMASKGDLIYIGGSTFVVAEVL